MAEALLRTSAKEYQIGRYEPWLSIPGLFINNENVTGPEFGTGIYPTSAFTPLRVPVLPRSFPAATVPSKESRIVPDSPAMAIKPGMVAEKVLRSDMKTSQGIRAFDARPDPSNN